MMLYPVITNRSYLSFGILNVERLFTHHNLGVIVAVVMIEQ